MIFWFLVDIWIFELILIGLYISFVSWKNALEKSGALNTPNYDWTDDETLTYEDVMARFESLTDIERDDG